MAQYRAPEPMADEGSTILVVGPVIVWLGLWAALLGWHVDDAGITYAYARSLAHGHGFRAFAGGPVAEGFSDPAWTLLLAAAAWLGAPIAAASKVLQAVLGAAVLVDVHRAVRSVGGERAEATAAALATAVAAPWVVWTAGGLETAWLGWCLVGFVAAVVGSRSGWIAGAFAAAVVLARPEGPWLALACLVAAEVLVPASRWRGRRVVAWGLPAAAFFGWLALRLAVFGDTLPTSFWVKAVPIDPSVRLLRGGIYLATFAAEIGLPLLALGWGAAWATRRLGRLARGLAIIVGADALAVLFMGGDWMRHGRLLAHVVPLIAMAGVPGLLALLFRPGDVGRRLLSGYARHLAWLFVVAYASISLLFWQDALRRPPLPMAITADSADLLATLGPAWCGAPRPRIATPDVGAALYRHPRAEVLDLAGLTDHTDARQASPGWWPARVARARPQAVLVHGVWVRRTGLDEVAMSAAGYELVCRRHGTPGVEEGRYPPALYRRADCRVPLSRGLEARLRDWCRRPR